MPGVVVRPGFEILDPIEGLFAENGLDPSLVLVEPDPAATGAAVNVEDDAVPDLAAAQEAPALRAQFRGGRIGDRERFAFLWRLLGQVLAVSLEPLPVLKCFDPLAAAPAARESLRNCGRVERLEHRILAHWTLHDRSSVADFVERRFWNLFLGSA